MTPEHARIPVTLLTGYLGSGKTTLLNRILSERHGHRIAVIENEFGAIGIDQALVINADEEVFEMSNGCICCTVRGDLIRILGSLMKRRDRFDYVLVETTGLADPAPVAQTFFVDADIRAEFRLDGIVTLVDAYHFAQQLARKECVEQVAFADVVVINKADLVDRPTLDAIEDRVRSMNQVARCLRSTLGDVPIDAVLSLRAFDLNGVLARRPSFLEPEYPFEWTGIYALEAGTWAVRVAPNEAGDPHLELAVLPLNGSENPSDSEGLRSVAERAVRVFAEPVVPCEAGGRLIPGTHQQVSLAEAGTFELVVDTQAPIALCVQHLPEEVDLTVSRMDGPVVGPLLPWEEAGRLAPRAPAPYTTLQGAVVDALVARAWVAQHTHDNEVGSVAIEQAGLVDRGRFNRWIGTLLRERGQDIFRMKGILSLADLSVRFVFQGVHMLFDGAPERPWGSRPRVNQLVFIGRNLDAEAIKAGFEACLVAP